MKTNIHHSETLSLDTDLELVFQRPELPNLVQTCPSESFVGIYSFVAVCQDGIWTPLVGYRNGARADAWFEGLVSGSAAHWEEAEEDVPDAATRFLERDIDLAVLTAHYDGSLTVDAITDANCALPDRYTVSFWMLLYQVDELWPHNSARK
jgi:hypothetical protein